MSHVPVSDALFGLTDTAQFAIIRKEAVDGEVVETKADIEYFQGVLQPLPPRKLLIKPEGQRTWKWWTLWTEQALALDNQIKDENGVLFRVLAVSDWRRAGGYFEYDLAEAPQ